MSGGREWAMTLDVQCRIETCPTRDSATVAGCSAHDATEGAKAVLRYRGWRIDRLDDLCPEHAGPIKVCELCGQSTPRPYGSDHTQHYTGKAWVCHPCAQAALKAKVREDFAKEMQRRPPSNPAPGHPAGAPTVSERNER